MIFLYKPLCCVLDYDCDHHHSIYHAEFSKLFCNVLSESIETFFRL